MRTKMLSLLKKNIGNMNHLYITCRVGLSLIDKDTKIKPELKASWDPVDYKMSVGRSELFLKKSTLIYLFEITEEYFLSVLKNKYFDIAYDPNVDTKSISTILFYIGDKYEVNQNYLDYVSIMRIFRNYLVHGKFKIADYEKSSYRVAKNRMIRNKDFYYINFNNLDITKTLNKIDHIIDGAIEENPSFKEVASCNSMVFLLVEEFEKVFLDKIDIETSITNYLSQEVIKHNKKILNYIKQGDDTRAVNYFKNEIRRNLIHLDDNKLEEIIKRYINEELKNENGL